MLQCSYTLIKSFHSSKFLIRTSLVAQTVKRLPITQETHGWWNLVGYSPWGRKETETTEQLHFLFLIHFYSLSIFQICI